MKNPFPYSSDNKRYHTFSYDTKKRYGQKVAKIGINAGFSCPNRDGTRAYGGCTFCNSLGSGDFQGKTELDLMEQFIHGTEIQRRKWPNAFPIAYFQAFTNTHAPLYNLKSIYDPFIQHPDVFALAIATRVDSLDEEIIAYLDQLAEIKDVYLELGLQTIHDPIAEAMNRAHSFDEFKQVFKTLEKTKLKVIVHLMNGYPGETVEMMIQSAAEVGKLKPYGIKIHMLNILRNSPLGVQYLRRPFEMMSRDEYIDCVIQQLRHIPPEVVILRLTGDGTQEDVLAPLWVNQKINVLNGIDKRMAALNVIQGDLC